MGLLKNVNVIESFIQEICSETLIHPVMKQVKSLGLFEMHRRCAERSEYDIKVPREGLESKRLLILLNRSCGTLMSYADRSAQRFSNETSEVFEGVIESFIQEVRSKTLINLVMKQVKS